ncbi:MAG: hypothetical protein QNL91_07095 [Candidatus Krumholzibacteria bacterium]|nr:hypothetical protein [Candidatus Krumholzibacteria bacterium]
MVVASPPGGATYAVAAVDEMGNESARLHFRYNCTVSDVEIDRP